jgi:zinc-ribbon domain
MLWGQGTSMNEPVHCPRCGTLNAASARFCQQCGFSLLGPAGSKGVPNANDQQPVPATGQPTGPQHAGPGPAAPNWSQGMLGGIAGFLLGSMLGGGRGFFGGWGGRDGDGEGFGGDGGGWGDGGGDFGGGGGDG